MSDKTDWLRRYASFQGSVQQLLAEDIVEHGKPHADREETFPDLKQRCIEMAGLAFEAYVTVCKIEEDLGAVLVTALKSTADRLEDVDYADRDPNGQEE